MCGEQKKPIVLRKFQVFLSSLYFSVLKKSFSQLSVVSGETVKRSWGFRPPNEGFVGGRDFSFRCWSLLFVDFHVRRFGFDLVPRWVQV